MKGLMLTLSVQHSCPNVTHIQHSYPHTLIKIN